MPLPFGLKLKRTRRYTVSSKSCLVTRIQLLNGEYVEFTLSVESTGQECLEAVAQRLELREITYFSLWYYNKQNQQRWIDLEKPLKKQLDKYGLEPTVYFGVVFYVSSVTQLQQEITRYQYYLQLKKDVLEGKIPCSIEQAIHLASLAVQADLGDFNRYDSQEFLQKIVLFPMPWIQDERVVEEATQKVSMLYQNYRGLSAPEAELLYMQEVEKMEGYGGESVQAKDAQSADVIIGSCLDGIFVKHKNGKAPLMFRWNDINNMTHNKSFFALELANKEDTIQFQTEDMETSKYVCRMWLARHKFYKINNSSLELSDGPNSEGSQRSILSLSFPRFPNLSRPSVPADKGQTQPAPVNTVRRRSSTRMSLPKPQPYMMPPQMHFNGHYTEPYTSSQDNLYINNQNGFYYHSQTSLDRSPHEYNGRIRNGSVYSAQSTSSLNNPQHYLQPSPMSSNPSITGSDLMRPDYVPSHRHSALIPPSYRATPDYETVMRQKNLGMIPPAERQSHSMRNLNIGNSYAYSRPKEHRQSLIHVSASAAETPPPVAQAMPPTASGSDINVVLEVTKPEDVIYGHKKSLSDATMLVHSSGEEEEFEDDSGRHTPQSQDAVGGPEHHMTPMGRPLVDPPAYPFSHGMETVLTGPLAYQSHPIICNPEDLGQLPPLREPGHMVPSVSEGDLSGQGRLRQKRDVFKRPVSDVPPARRNIDGLPPAGMKKGRSEVKKVGPLKMASLNGLTLSRMPLPDEGKDDPENASNDERCKILEQRMEQGMVFTEYEQVPKKRPNCECTIALMPENSDRNRFQDVLPYDDTRVELVPTKENNTGYINASHIRFTVRGKEWSYIASQGPLSSTCQDFWQMVWEQGVAIIAMVTAEEEGGREKSFRYWPRLGSRHNTVTYGRFKITTRFRTDSGCYATTGLKIKHLLTGQERTVWHLQYTDWPDHGCPEDFKGFLSYLEEIQSVRRHTNSSCDPKNTNLPVLVHCSAGVGRTGVVILSEIMIACLEHNEMLDVPTVLNLLRQQRMMMVQTLSQYTFIYKVLIQFLRNSRLI
ncbi:tyrosine-protein phosphatase non-receptor type 21-like [Sinocyclocheilus anshuiensis]|uniref:tyrosine-protein phosphatase non-receptor type 21-like n=1 Tax=Sinocyclocheilus anshuiensis TaxID=1608454 RepID=UPI0007B925F9|nr:PREDICTED: tyrosine-protein phosphatase non-receptor type 21-like [Sinocyclocheilus anshuiensis]